MKSIEEKETEFEPKGWWRRRPVFCGSMLSSVCFFCLHHFLLRNFNSWFTSSLWMLHPLFITSLIVLSLSLSLSILVFKGEWKDIKRSSPRKRKITRDKKGLLETSFIAFFVMWFCVSSFYFSLPFTADGIIIDEIRNELEKENWQQKIKWTNMEDRKGSHRNETTVKTAWNYRQQERVLQLICRSKKIERRHKWIKENLSMTSWQREHDKSKSESKQE